MFGSLLREFEEDPFFSEPFTAHRERMRNMMRSFSEPFGQDSFLSIADGRDRNVGRNERSSLQVDRRGDLRDTDVMDDFLRMDNIMANMRNRLSEAQNNLGRLSLGPDAHSFSSSSVMTYSKVGNEPPKIFKAESQTRKAPGGIKETKQALKDSENGVEKVAVGHHINDRAHVIKKSKNCRTGSEEVHQEFVNLEESEAPTFDEEWKRNVVKYGQSAGRSHLPVQAPKGKRSNEFALINNRDSPKREKPRSKASAGYRGMSPHSAERLNV